MNIQDISSHTDLTYLKFEPSIQPISNLIQDAAEIDAASICIYPAFVGFARKELNSIGKNQIGVCTVVNFPHGANTYPGIYADTQSALQAGANEIDFVLPYSHYLNGHIRHCRFVLKALADLCHQYRTRLKVIVETALTAPNCEEKQLENLYELCFTCGADFIKTSTGFSSRGANLKEISFWHNLPEELQIKASGGINTYNEAEAFIRAGANRLGIGSSYRNIFFNEDVQSDY